MKRSERDKATRQRRLAAGLCSRCCNERERKDRKKCNRCLRLSVGYVTARKVRRDKGGMCKLCGKVKARMCCDGCKRRQSEWCKLYRQKQRHRRAYGRPISAGHG